VRKDKSRVNILKLSEFGLVQMTRKRSCESLSQMMCEPCFYCGGDGVIKSQRTICYEIFRKITRDARKIKARNVTIKVHPRIADMLLREEAQNMDLLEDMTAKRFTIIPLRDIHIKRYEIIWNE
jgi:ribonuclease G